MSKTTIDLLYCNPDKETKKLLKKIKATIEDASDDIHTKRVAIYYSIDKKEKYKEILIKKGIIGNSMSFLTGNL